ncbi:MAG TPA: glycosyltransferase family 4 protein [Chloroflexota bacterium]|nr:glycosyltransferase family 4 protein [Chloroflexota bacterium]
MVADKPRVLLVSPYDLATPGGVAGHVVQLARNLDERGYASSILAPLSHRPGFRPSARIWPVGPVIAVPTNGSVARISLSLRLAGDVRAALRELEPEIVHLHEPFMPLLPFAALRHSSATNVATFHAFSGNAVGYRTFAPLLRHYAARLDGRIAVSETARAFVAGHFPGEYQIIPNGVEWERFASATPYADLADDPPTILFVGRLDRRKGFPVLLRAFAELCRRGSPARLLVVGAYDAEQTACFQRVIAREGIPNVCFAGYADVGALARYYQSSSIVCVPSLGSESFGMVLLEAMAAGKPVVASAIAGYREVLEDGEQGLLVPPGSVPHLTDALDALLRDPDRRRALGRAGAVKARDYAWPAVVDRITEVYAVAAARRGTMVETGAIIV